MIPQYLIISLILNSVQTLPNNLLNIKTYHKLICTCDHKCFEKTVIIKLGNKNDTERKQIFLFEAVLYCFVWYINFIMIKWLRKFSQYINLGTTTTSDSQVWVHNLSQYQLTTPFSWMNVFQTWNKKSR